MSNLALPHLSANLALSKRVLAGSSAFALCLSLQRAVSILLLPIYIRVLTPADYGRIALVVTLASVLSAVVAFGLETSIFRTYFKLADRPAERDQFLNSVWLFLLTVPNVIAAFVLACALLVIPYWGSLPFGLVTLGLFTGSVYVSASTLPFAVLRAQERLKAYVGMNLVYVGVLTATMITTVVALDMGPTGWFVSTLSASLVLLLAGPVAMGRFPGHRVRARDVKEGLAFGVPLVPHYLAHWGLSLSDRAILSAWVSLATLGVYNFAYQVGAILGILVVALQQAMQPYYVRAATGDEAAKRELGMAVTLQAFTVALLAVGMALLGPPLVRILFAGSYASASGLIPWIVLGYAFYGLYFIPMNVISLIAGETRWVWLATVAAAVANVAFNLMMIPDHGIEAAAIGTALGYGALLLCVTVYMLVGRHHLELNWKVLAIGLTTIVAVYPAATFMSPQGNLEAFVTRGALVLAAPLVLIIRLLPVRGLEPSDR